MTYLIYMQTVLTQRCEGHRVKVRPRLAGGHSEDACTQGGGRVVATCQGDVHLLTHGEGWDVGR